MTFNEVPSASPSSSSSTSSTVRMHAVVPLPECPHLHEVREIPPQGVDARAPCSACQSTSAEQWACLTCYAVNCGRYVGGHAVHHQTRTGHPMALSFADLSVWCYMCESYVHNEILIPAKNAAHRSKFGVPDPQHETSAEDSQ